DAVQRARTWYDERVLVEVRDGAVVNVNRELVGEKVSDRRVRAQKFEDALEFLGVRNARRNAVEHHLLKQLEVVLMLARPAESSAGHDVRSRVNTLAARVCAGEDAVVTGDFKGAVRDISEFSPKQF